MLTDTTREEIARAICLALSRDPDRLEPGDAYGVDAVVDGEPCHYVWRHFQDEVDEHFEPIINRLIAEAEDRGLERGAYACEMFALTFPEEEANMTVRQGLQAAARAGVEQCATTIRALKTKDNPHG